MTLILQNDSFTRWEGLVDLSFTSMLLLKVQFRVVVAWFGDVGKSGMNRHIISYPVYHPHYKDTELKI